MNSSDEAIREAEDRVSDGLRDVIAKLASMSAEQRRDSRIAIEEHINRAARALLILTGGRA